MYSLSLSLSLFSLSSLSSPPSLFYYLFFLLPLFSLSLSTSLLSLPLSSLSSLPLLYSFSLGRQYYLRRFLNVLSLSLSPSLSLSLSLSLSVSLSLSQPDMYFSKYVYPKQMCQCKIIHVKYTLVFYL